MSKKSRCQGHRNRSAVSVTRITVDIGHPNQVDPHCCRSPKLPQNVRFHQTQLTSVYVASSFYVKKKKDLFMHMLRSGGKSAGIRRFKGRSTKVVTAG